MHWWHPNRQKTEQGMLVYRERFEDTWSNLPPLTVLAALPGWGKSVWIAQCLAYLALCDISLSVTRVRNLQELEGLCRDTVTADRLISWDAEQPSDEDWEGIARFLQTQPAVRLIVTTLDEPPRDALTEETLVLREGDLAFSEEELEGLERLLTDEGMLFDLTLRSGSVLGCPYLVGQRIRGLRAHAHTGVWKAANDGDVLLLHAHLWSRMKRLDVAHTQIAKLFDTLSALRTIPFDIVETLTESPEISLIFWERLQHVPLFESGTDDEGRCKKLTWKPAAWNAFTASELLADTRQRLRQGLERITETGRIAARLLYLLELDELATAEHLVRSEYRWFLVYIDVETANALEQLSSISARREPALTLIRTEMRLRRQGFSVQLRADAEEAWRSLASQTGLTVQTELERAGLLAYAAALAGLRAHVLRAIVHVQELVNEAEFVSENGDSRDRVRAIGALYLAY
ncbi:hypothetical protein [Leucobacter chinensis]|uniref:hypothetical protein n=1 Tax=Leucobacter chinensis TaxID=2851010 RepID=UPI001C24F926|nr:hypothetical protein [Leucobacter chinensis]